MKIGCCTTIQGGASVAKAGFDYLELPGRSITALDDSSFANFVNDWKAWGIPCLGLNAYCPPEIVIAGPGFNRETTRLYAERCAERAARIGVQIVGIGSPKSRILPDDFSRELALEQVSEFLTITTNVFAKQGIVVCLEALAECYCNCVNSVDEAIMIIDRIKLPNLAIVIDFYNMEHNDEDGMRLAPIIDKIAHVHMSDDKGSPQQRSFLSEAKRGRHTERVQRLISAGYQGCISIEIDVQFDFGRAVHSLAMLKDASVNRPS